MHLEKEEDKLAVARTHALLERWKAELDEDDKILLHQKEVAAAEAECRVLQSEIEEEQDFDKSQLTVKNLGSNGKIELNNL